MGHLNPTLSDPSPRINLPDANNIAPGITGIHKPLHHDKVTIHRGVSEEQQELKLLILGREGIKAQERTNNNYFELESLETWSWKWRKAPL